MAATPPTWDAGTIFVQSIQAATDGTISNSGYFLLFPNNIGILTLFTLYFKVLALIGQPNFTLAVIVLNVAIMFATSVLVFLISRKLFGKAAALLSIPISFVLITMSPHVNVSYTDTVAMIFPPLILYLTLRLKGSTSAISKYIFCFLIGVLGYTGYKIKPTVAIILLAILLVGIVATLVPRSKKLTVASSLQLLAATTLGVVGAYGAFMLTVSSLHILPFPLEVTKTQSTPLTYFVAMGLEEQHFPNNITTYGGYNQQDFIDNAQLSTRHERNLLAIHKIKNRLKEHGWGYPYYLIRKAAWIYSDATFSAYREGGSTNVKFYNTDSFSTSIRSVIFANGKHYPQFVFILSVFWLTVLSLLVYPFFMANRNSPNTMVTLLRLSVIGLTAFILLTEGRSRYLYCYIGIFIILAMYSVQCIGARYINRSQKEETTAS